MNLDWLMSKSDGEVSRRSAVTLGCTRTLHTFSARAYPPRGVSCVRAVAPQSNYGLLIKRSSDLGLPTALTADNSVASSF